jgi:hypothetical protein
VGTSSLGRDRRLRIEPLETRDLMAVTGITTSFSAGVLTINGTDKADVINIRQAFGWIGVDGVNAKWSNQQITSIVVNLKNGNDVVSLYSMNEALTVNSGQGTEHVHLNDGRDVVFTGLGHQLKVTAAGAASLDGRAVNSANPTPTPTPPAPTPPAPTPPSPSPPAVTNWFTTHVQDLALRTLGSTLFGDGLINRSDLISLFRNAEDGGVIDATELTDLRSIVSTTTLFGSLDYVWTLGSYIVSANPANATYQGYTLGNLAAGSNSAQMEKLIGKWFLGTDHPIASGTYRQFSGQLFVSGASYTDIHQGAVGDCYFMTTIAETALKNPSAITNMFIVNGDGTYTVRFYNGSGAAQYVTVDSYLPTDGSGALIYAGRGMKYNSSSNELWTALVEKAFVQVNQSGWERAGLPGNGLNAYAAISGGYINSALKFVIGQNTVNFVMTGGGTSFSAFVAAFNSGKSIGFASYSTPASKSVVGNHAYAVVGYNASAGTVTLFNPWGIEYGLVTMSWAQIQQNFQYFDRTA